MKKLMLIALVLCAYGLMAGDEQEQQVTEQEEQFVPGVLGMDSDEPMPDYNVGSEDVD